MLSIYIATLLGAASVSGCTAPVFTTIEPSLKQIKTSAATAPTFSFKGEQYVPGKAFDRFYTIFLENTDYDKAVGQSGLADLAKQGILLTNYFGLTHPSQPNYLASAAGDYFGLQGDQFVSVPDTIFNVADLLDYGGISWAEYQEDLPYSGFQGYNFSNQETFANDYVRKHNPLVHFGNVVSSSERLSKIKNFTQFDSDLAFNALPQWAFITPNMTNDGHDSTIEVAGNWAYNFITPLLGNSYFTDRTLLVLTFDETETYTIPNRVAAILLGDIPESLKGTSDATYYDHYSLLATVQNNWALPNLGRNDCGANVFNIVAQQTGHENRNVDVSSVENNVGESGYLSCSKDSYPKPNLSCQGAGGPVLPAIVSAYS